MSFIKPFCLFCQSESYSGSNYPSFIFNDKKFEYVTCNSCKLVYLSPLLMAEDLNALYSIDYHNEFYFTGEKKYIEQWQILSSLNIKGKLLDYGCGDGRFLNFFTGKGFELYGAEYNPILVSQLKEANPLATFFTIDGLLQNDDLKFDIIHLGDVLEHLNNPADIVDKLKARLNPKGVLFIEGPIEHNTSFAHFTRTQYHFIRKALQPKRVIDLKPYHVFFANRNNQFAFFQLHQLKSLHYQIFEWSWPYPDKLSDAKTISRKVQFLLGYMSINFFRLKNWGNRFYYIGQNI